MGSRSELPSEVVEREREVPAKVDIAHLHIEHGTGWNRVLTFDAASQV
jgi:hypothetical protein